MKNKKIISIIIILSVFLFTELFFFLFSFEFKSWQYKIRDNLFKLRYALNGREDLYPFLYSVSCIDSDLRNLNIHGNVNMIYVDLLRALKGSNVKGIGIDHVFTGNILYSEADPLVNATGELKNVYYPVIPYQYNYNYNPALNPGQPVLAKKIL